MFDKELSQARFNILLILKYYGNDGLCQKDILARMVSTKGNLSIHIKNLVAQGYVCKNRSESDRRQDTVRLTAEGERVLKRVEPEYMRHIDMLTRGQSAADAGKLTELLEGRQDTCLELLTSSEQGGDE